MCAGTAMDGSEGVVLAVEDLEKGEREGLVGRENKSQRLLAVLFSRQLHCPVAVGREEGK